MEYIFEFPIKGRCHYQIFLWQSFWWNFDSERSKKSLIKNFDQLWWNRTPSYFFSNFDGLWWISTNQNTVLEWWDDVYKTKAHGKGKISSQKTQCHCKSFCRRYGFPKFGILSLSISGLTFSRSTLNVVLSILK